MTCKDIAPIKQVDGLTINTTYLQTRNCAVLGSRDIQYIVMHYTGNSKDTALANAKYFAGSDLEASAHYFVDDSSIYQSVAAKDRAWHCGASKYTHPSCRNQNSIGIEMCCSGNYTVSQTTIRHAAALCAALCRYLGISDVDRYVLRHYDVTGKACPAQMVRDAAQWTAFRAQAQQLLKEDGMKKTIEVEDTTVKVGKQTVDAMMVGDTTWVPMRAYTEAIKAGITVNWSHADGASVTL